MAQQRRGLGRGLGALIPEAPPRSDAEAPESGPRTYPRVAAIDGSAYVADDTVDIPGVHYEEIPVTSISPNPRQPRRTFDEDALDELADSIREVGLLQPVVVRAVGGGSYELIMGERRWRASQRAGLVEIAAIV